jgi:protein-tyrosine phosphatase
VRDFAVLAVCTGNICRSPLAAALLDRALDHARCSSTGTRAVTGAPVPPPMLEQASLLGLDLGEHRAGDLTTAVVQSSSLVLCLAREHRSAVARAVPRATRWTFTLAEFARLSRAVDHDDLARAVESQPSPADRLTAATALVAARRGSGVLVAPGDDDVVDPFGHGAATYLRAVRQMTTATTTVAEYFTRALAV